MFESKTEMEKTQSQTKKNLEVLVFDPTGKLNSARWRLKSDGFRVNYVQDDAGVEKYITRQETGVVVLKAESKYSIETVKRLAKIKDDFEIIAITEKKIGQLAQRLSVPANAKIMSRPIDYPLLSANVKSGLTNIAERKQEGGSYNADSCAKRTTNFA